MKRFLSILLAAVMLLALAACDAAQEAETQTRYVLTEMVRTMSDGTQTRTVYHFDENWVSTGITVYAGDQVSLEVSHEYDDHGGIKTMTYTAGETVEAHAYDTTYDDDGNPIRVEATLNGVHQSTTEYTYENGVKTAMTQRVWADYMNGDILFEYTYNPDGTVASMTVTYPDMGGSTTEYRYDAEGNETAQIQYQDGKKTQETVTVYENGIRTEKLTTDYDDEGNALETSTVQYLREGNTETWQIVNPDGSIDDQKVVLVYDEAGNIISEEHYNGETLISRQICTYQAVEVAG